VFTFKDGNIPVKGIENGKCLVDLPFEWAYDLNAYTLKHIEVRDMLYIFDDFCFDAIFCSFLYLYYVDTLNLSFFLGAAVNTLTKKYMQENLLTLAQPSGYNYYFPGVYSLMIPWYDIADFYFSGRISTTIGFMYASYVIWCKMPHSKLAKWTFMFLMCFRIPYIWTVMTITYTHFVIDFLSGIAMGCLSILLAEKLIYYLEVKIEGKRTKDR